MKYRSLTIAAVMLGIGVTSTASSDALAAEPNVWPYCTRTAQMAFTACRFDVADDYHLGRAICINESDPIDRQACHGEVALASSEAQDTCASQRDARIEVCDELGQDRYDPPFDEEDFVHPDTIEMPNPYLSLEPGHTTVFRAEGELVVVYVTDEIKVIDDVPCRVVVDVALEVGFDETEEAVEYLALEVTDDWYAQHENGDVWYCGELSRNFEDGQLADLEGSFQAGEAGAKGGILIRFDPQVGETYRQEFALGEAEDLAHVLSLAASPGEEVAGFACNGACLMTREFTPMSPGAEEYKFYLPGTGFVLAVGLEDGVPTGGGEELVCAGASLDVLSEEACGVEDLPELLATLCEVAPETCPESGPDPRR